jgi:hypothetical protein
MYACLYMFNHVFRAQNQNKVINNRLIVEYLKAFNACSAFLLSFSQKNG